MKLSLITKTNLVDNIWSFVFEAEHALDYEAGQYIRVQLDHSNADNQGPKRYFTNAAAPHEGVVQIVTRLTGSTFKTALSRLSEGDENLEMINPHEGDFTWQDIDRPTLYVAGGLGVRPYHSILTQRVRDGKAIPVTLLYNGRTDALPWKDTFAELSASNPEFSVVYQIDEPISREKLRSRFPMLNESLVYLSGPEAMVVDVGEQLKKTGLPDDQLLQEWLPNYDEDADQFRDRGDFPDRRQE